LNEILFKNYKQRWQILHINLLTNNMRILAVEDDRQIADFLKTNLKKENYSVDLAEDGEKGLFLALTNEYDLIILDIGLPKKDGYEVCRELRRSGKTLPVIILSAESEINTKINLLDAGADDFINKPYSFEELLARIRALLRRPKPIEQDILQIDDLSLDTKNFIIKRAEKEIHLTPKEFSLLEYLMRNKGTVVSRGKILEHIYDMSADPFSNSIEMHIANLRRKIALPNSRELIHTLPGRGYKVG
jgi:DNA-binding response OmpR family regulator